MLKITIERTNGTVETVHADLWRSHAKGGQQYAKLVQANAEAAAKDHSKGGKVLDAVYIDEYVKDTSPEAVAWAKLETARAIEADAYRQTVNHGGGDDGTGRLYGNLAVARDNMQQAIDAYLAEWGETGKHWAERAARIAQDKADREERYQNSYVARGLD